MSEHWGADPDRVLNIPKDSNIGVAAPWHQDREFGWLIVDVYISDESPIFFDLAQQFNRTRGVQAYGHR